MHCLLFRQTYDAVRGTRAQLFILAKDFWRRKRPGEPAETDRLRYGGNLSRLTISPGNVWFTCWNRRKVRAGAHPSPPSRRRRNNARSFPSPSPTPQTQKWSRCLTRDTSACVGCDSQDVRKGRYNTLSRNRLDYRSRKAYTCSQYRQFRPTQFPTTTNWCIKDYFTSARSTRASRASGGESPTAS